MYETDPVGPSQPDFLNAAVLLDTSLDALDLLQRVLDIERDHGRERRERWGPRTLDLDLLWSDGSPIQSPGLTLPHPRVVERAFALAPLLDVFPDHPAKVEFESHFQRSDRRGVRCIAVTPEWDERVTDSLEETATGPSKGRSVAN